MIFSYRQITQLSCHPIIDPSKASFVAFRNPTKSGSCILHFCANDSRVPFNLRYSLYCKYGYYFEALDNVYYEGAAGAQKIKNILDSYRSDAPKEIGGIAVTEMKDFGMQTFEDADRRQPAPQAGLFYFSSLENGYQYAVRGSGTEPKIKFYLFGHEDVADPSELDEKKALTQAAIETMKTAILADADRRADGLIGPYDSWITEKKTHPVLVRFLEPSLQ